MQSLTIVSRKYVCPSSHISPPSHFQQKFLHGYSDILSLPYNIGGTGYETSTGILVLQMSPPPLWLCYLNAKACESITYSQYTSYSILVVVSILGIILL